MPTFARRSGRRVTSILAYEPSWFAECISAVGILLWSMAAFYSDDFLWTRWAFFMPLFGIFFAPLRLILLANLNAFPRVLAGMIGFIWWGWVAVSLRTKFGVVPMMGVAVAVAIGDLLTVGKFSLQVIRDTHEDGRN